MVFDRLFQSTSLRNVGMLASATAMGQLIIVLASPILTRLYSPEEFGVYAVFVALLGLISVASSFRFELAIPISRYNLSAFHLLSLAMSINVVFSALSLVAIVILRGPIAAWTKTPALAGYLWLLPVSVFLFGTVRVLTYWAVRHLDYGRVAYTKLSQSVANVIIQIAAGIAKFGVLGLIIGQIFGQAAGVVSLARFAKKTFPALARFSVRRMRLVATRQLNFARYDTPAAIIDTASEQLPALLFAVLFNPAIAGFYLLAQRILSMPVSLIGQAIGQVLYGQCRQAIEDRRLGEIVRKTVYMLVALVLAPTVVVVVWGEDMFNFVFGVTWHQSGQFASWMIVGIAAQFAYSPVSSVLQATKGQHVNLIIHSTLLVTRLAGILLGWIQNDIRLAIAAFSICGFFGYALGTILVLRRANSWSQPGNRRAHGCSVA